MEIVKAFNDNNLHTEIIIKGSYEEPLFRANDVGEILEMGNIRSTIQHFDDTEKRVHSMDTSTGPKQVTFLTEKGLYKVLFKSRKPIAEKFQNWVCEIIKEIRLNGVYDLQKQLEKQKTDLQTLEKTKNKEMEEKLATQKILEREKVLLKEYETIGSIFYIIKIKTFENGQYIVKIGESRIGILGRYKEHKSKYDECLLLDCFLVNRSRDFESFIKDNENVSPSKVTDLLGHENEKELFLIGKNLSYKTLLNIVNNNIKYFNDNNNEIKKLELELEILKMKENTIQTNNDNANLKVLLKIVNTLTTKINNLEISNKAILDKLNSQQTKVVTGFNEQLVTLGPRLQKINPETLQLIKVYETITECIKENIKIKRPSINKAINENTIYHGFRWLLVDRSLDPNIILNIQPTKITRPQNLGYIAKLNKEKTEILNVYLDRKTSAIENGYSSSSALDTPVKNFTITNGYYYILYDDCEEELREEFIIKNNNQEPLLYKNGVGQYDVENNLIQEFICKQDCIKTLRISDKTLEKALQNNILYNGNYFKLLGCKVKCF